MSGVDSVVRLQGGESEEGTTSHPCPRASQGRLLQGGVHKLLLVATYMTLLRQKLAAHQGAQVTTVAARGGLDIYEGKG